MSKKLGKLSFKEIRLEVRRSRRRPPDSQHRQRHYEALRTAEMDLAQRLAQRRLEDASEPVYRDFDGLYA